MKLSFENIRFIDNYLDNSNIKYKDIRMEMLDHIASEIETRMANGDSRSFYYIFKDYMVDNKARLINNNKKFLKSADKKILKLLLSNFFSIFGLLIFVGLSCVLFFTNNYSDIEVFKDVLLFIPFAVLLLFGILYVIALKVYKLERFSVIERIAFPFVLIFHLFSFFNNVFRSSFVNEFNVTYIIIGISFIMTIVVLLFKITLDLAKVYRKRFDKVT